MLFNQTKLRFPPENFLDIFCQKGSFFNVIFFPRCHISSISSDADLMTWRLLSLPPLPSMLSSPLLLLSLSSLWLSLLKGPQMNSICCCILVWKLKSPEIAWKQITGNGATKNFGEKGCCFIWCSTSYGFQSPVGISTLTSCFSLDDCLPGRSSCSSYGFQSRLYFDSLSKLDWLQKAYEPSWAKKLQP